MKFIKAKILAAIMSATAMVVPASAEVIDFDATPQNGCGSLATSGLTFSTPFCGGVYTNNPVSSNGSPAYVYGYGPLSVVRTGGGNFTINSLLAGISYYSGQTSSPINYTFNLAAGGTASGTFTIGQGFQTFAFGAGPMNGAQFSGLSDGYVALDNISVGFGGVPEPATWAFMILGFGAIGVGMRRRNSNARARVKFATA